MSNNNTKKDALYCEVDPSVIQQEKNPTII